MSFNKGGPFFLMVLMNMLTMKVEEDTVALMTKDKGVAVR